MASESGAKRGQDRWRVSLHGGHSGEFCDHAEGTLRDILEAAIRAGYAQFGVSEHAPRNGEEFLYEKERSLGWDVPKIQADFARYIETVNRLQAEYADRLTVLRGMEAEIVPTATYAAQMRAYRETKLPDGAPALDYMVGSVHYVDEISIDGPTELYAQALEGRGGLESLAVRYYGFVGEMVEGLKPEVVGHFDLIKLNAHRLGLDVAVLENAPVKAAANRALEAIKAQGCILDLNVAGWRKGLPDPYPAPWLAQRAGDMGIGFCFGDDSHRVSDVGAGIDKARMYLLENGVEAITLLSGERVPL